MMKLSGRWEPTHIKNIVFPEEELQRAARTLVGRPVRVNFKGDAVGHVVDAEYTLGGIDYVVEIPSLKAGFTMRYMEGRKIRGVTFTELSLTSHCLKGSTKTEVN